VSSAAGLDAAKRKIPSPQPVALYRLSYPGCRSSIIIIIIIIIIITIIIIIIIITVPCHLYMQHYNTN